MSLQANLPLECTSLRQLLTPMQLMSIHISQHHLDIMSGMQCHINLKKNGPLEFQNIINNLFNSYTSFSIVHINTVFIFSDFIDQYWKHLNVFLTMIKNIGMAVLVKKVLFYQNE